MLRRALLVGQCCVLAASAGCYIRTQLPLDRDLDRTPLGSKVGRASVQSVLWGVAWGDAGIQAAARNGGLETIHHADQEIFVVLGGAYARLTTVVYGD
jgi:hypothetical protein